jgi:hypothetical protein
MNEVAAVQGYCPKQHFFIQDGRMRQATEDELCAGENGCLAGVPQPDTPTATAECAGCDRVGMAWLYTYVSRHGGVQVEGPPSNPSAVVTASGQTPNATLTFGETPTGYCISTIRIYRVESKFEDGESEMPIVGSEFVLVEEVHEGTRTYVDEVNSMNTGYPLTTHDPKNYPAPEAQFITRTEDSVVVADKHRVYISTAGQPQFGTEGVVNVEDEIRCIQSIGNTIFVLTDNYPVKIKYRITEGMLSIKRETIHRRLPLSSYKSVSTYGSRVYFASEYSLYSWDIGGYGSDVRSTLNELMTPHQWKMIDPNTVIGTAYEYGYIFSSSTIDYSIMLEFGGDGTDTRLNTSLMPISYINPDVFGLDYDGHIIYREGNRMFRWDYREQSFCDDQDIQDSDKRKMCDECCPYTIHLYADSEGKNHFRVMRVEWDECSAYSLELSFRQEHFCKVDDLVTQEEPLKILSSRGFNIPYFVSAQAHSARIQGCGTIHEVRFATAYADLVNEGTNNVE